MTRRVGRPSGPAAHRTRGDEASGHGSDRPAHAPRAYATRLAAVLVAVVVLVSTTGLGLGAAPATSTASVSTTAAAPPVVAQQTPVNNSTATVDRHQNPTNDTEPGDLSRVSARLSSSLASRLGQSSITLSRDQYELARQYVGSEYRDGLSQYVEVAAQTRTASDDQLADQFNETAASQRRLAGQLERFDEAQRTYRQARQRGNDTAARQSARELRRLADEINGTRANLIRDYSVISSRTTVDLSDASTVLDETVARRIAAAEAIQNAEFARTELVVTTPTDEASFRDPVRLRGRLTSNGSALGDRAIRLDVGTRSLTTTTDGDGRFTVDYRPVTQPLGPQTLRVQYVPGNETNLQTSNDTVQVTLSQVRPSVDVTLSPAAAGLDDTVRVTGDVTVDGVAAPSTPFVVSLDGERVVTGRTTVDGAINENITLSMRTQDGDRPVRVVVGAEDQSLGPAEATRTLTVRSSTPSLSLNATLLNQSGPAPEQRTVVVRGRLTTPDGDGVAGQPIQLLVGGVETGTVETDRDGFYETTVQIPAGLLPREVGGEERIEITASYDAEETLFEATTRTSSVLVQAELLAVVGRNVSASESVVAFVVVGSALALRRRYGRAGDRVDSSPVETPSDGATTGDDSNDSGPPPIALARRLLEGERTDAAVEFAYRAVRAAAARAYDLPRTDTHWEFVSTYRNTSAASDATVDAITRLTALYERAAFDNRSVADQEASEALSLVESILDSMERGDADSRTAAATPIHTDGGESDSPDR